MPAGAAGSRMAIRRDGPAAVRGRDGTRSTARNDLELEMAAVVETATSPCDVVKRFFDEAFNRGNAKVCEELVAVDHVSHLPNGDHYGPEGVRIDVHYFRAAFPDLKIELEELIEAPERVIYRFTARGTHDGPFMGIPPSGRRVEVQGIGIDRLQDGKTVERWVQYDSAGLLQQLGVLPA
jgi:steroid delta-isomerase-like uncharacterized protein